MLDTDPKLKQDFQTKIQSDTTFAANDWLQMDYLYQRSKHFEKSYLRYPVTRLEEKVKLPVEK
jgi:hypothetical protein